MCLKKTSHLTFDHNFGKCKLISKILSQIDSWGNFVYIHYQDSLPHHKYVSTLPREMRITIAVDFMWGLRVHLAIYEAVLIARVWILWLKNLGSIAAVLRRGSMMSVNWSSGWLTCNMGSSRQLLMKLVSVNGVNVCELVFILPFNVHSTCFNFWTICIYKVGGLQWVGRWAEWFI